MSSNFSTVKNPESCPGLREFLRPTVAYVKCHICGGNVEIWSDEDVGTCTACGAKWTQPEKENSCLDYCEFADKCKDILEQRKT